MSNLERRPVAVECGGRSGTPGEPVYERVPGREVMLGESTKVRRLLPTLGRRLVGAWCFLDHYGPDDIAGAPGMQVPPHPHIGLQTVSWLLDGEVHHRDSLGNDVTIRPGQLGLMTAGRAIAHSEQSPPVHPALLHGAQLWVALPGHARDVAPAFEHHATLPVLTDGGLRATVLLGELAGAVSPGTVHSPLVGADLELEAGADALLPLEPDFEYAVIVASGNAGVDGAGVRTEPAGDAEVADARVAPGELLYLGTGRTELRVRAQDAARLLLLGGEPFAERIVMWWNFVAADGEAVAAAREDWMAGRRFGTVAGGDPLPAPALPPTPLIPRGRTR
ncbi:pirin family protein [Pseudonocardia acaciae]|uniref:pirin family protein n=1 Tax=Pseudonocardia acaciae TaxID=551276 RepID=UPI00048F8723|nr:pirin family protein [Pseudonocardia acaciae]